MLRRNLIISAWMLSACSEAEKVGADGSVSDAGRPSDAALADAAVGDAAPVDVGMGDGGPADARPDATPTRDAATPTPDAGSEDASPVMDAGTTPAENAYFPPGAWMYQDISQHPVAADSTTRTQWLQNAGGFGLGRMQIDFSIEVLEATANTPYEAFEPTGDFYSPDCDEVAFPVPAGGALEGESGYACLSDGDCHLLVVDRRVNKLFEMWRADIRGGTFSGGCAAVWNMNRVYPPEGRGEQCTSADAAGFPITPLLFTAEEVAAGEIAHAIRFILPNARMRSGYYQRPGTHAGGPSGPAEAPIYGSRWRLRSDFDLSSLPNDAARVVARALQKYGMALADGGNVALTARSDQFSAVKWDGLLGPRDLAGIQPTDFEILDTGAPIRLTYDCVRTPE